MGCVNTKSSAQQPNILPQKPTGYQQVGYLKVSIQQLNLMDKNESFLSASSNFIRLNLSSQQYATMVHHNFGSIHNIKPEQTEFIFSINTLNRERQLLIQIYRIQQLRSQKKLAHGQQDVSPLIFNKQINTSNDEKILKLRLDSVDGNKLAWLNLNIRFQPQKYQILSIRVNSVTLRNKSEHKRKIYIRIVVGDEIYQSASAQQSKKKIPQWTDAVHNFIVPQSLQEGHLEVYEKNEEADFDDLLGQLKFNLKTILAQNGLQLFSQQISLRDQITGTIKLQTLKNQNRFLQEVKINSPIKIKVKEDPLVKKIETYQNVNHVQSYKKTLRQTTTNYTEDRLSLALIPVVKKAKKSSSDNPKTERARPILPPIPSCPNTARQSYKRFSDGQNLQIREQIEQNPESSQSSVNLRQKKMKKYSKQSSIHESKLQLQKTESILIKKDSEEVFKQIQEGLKQIAQWEKQKQNDFKSKIHIRKVQSEDQGETDKKGQNRKSLHAQKQTKRKLNILKTESKLINRKQSAEYKFTQIQNDLESRSIQQYKTSAVYISVEKGYSEFDASLKEQSNQLKREQDNQFEIMDFGNDKVLSSQIDENSFKKRLFIKDLNKLTGLDEKLRPSLNLNSAVLQKQNVLV